MNQLRQWVKARQHPVARAIYAVARAMRQCSVPVIPGVHRALYALHTGLAAAIGSVLRIVWYTPLFKSRLSKPAPHLYLYGGLPFVSGPLTIEIGADCRVSAATTFSGRAASGAAPSLVIGRNVDIGWQTTIAVGQRVHIGDNVRIAGRAFLAGYPGHPIDAADRAAGAPDTADQVGDIIIEEDAWLATGVTVLGGVRIGRGTIVAAGSVVTRDLPAFVVAAGIPARPVRRLDGKALSEQRVAA